MERRLKLPAAAARSDALRQNPFLIRSQLDKLTDPTTFLWATGIEDTFITAPWAKTGRTLDEYELTGHYENWREDIDLMAELGLKAARYGIPWHRLQPSRDQWDWTFADQTLGHLLERNIEPIVDLVHYGLPPWIEDAFLNPDFPERMAEYAARVAERFKGQIHAYTPLNEPRITAWYCGKLGWWPPFRKGWRGFVAVMIGLCRGIVQTTKALERIDPENVAVHVDATDLYESADAELAGEVGLRQEIVFLALDLVSGRVDAEHPLHGWLLKHGAREKDLDWFQEHAVTLEIVGINLYPMFSKKILARSRNGLRIRMPYAGAEIIERLSELYWQRYHAPIFISETASVGSVKRRRAWLESSIEAVKKVRARGIPLVGYTWWPLFALVTWAYRQGANEPSYYLKQMGLWNLAADEQNELRRVPTPLVGAVQEIVAAGWERVGSLEMIEEIVT
jgi:beta-glucosidase/6-phospho-beta-glucosidase/beta-galactosidase